MGRSPCCDEIGLKKGPWTPEEDKVLVEYIQKNGHGSWRRLPKLAGLNRCGKSCRLRWTNYLRPDIKRGRFDDEEERLIIHLHSILGNKWSAIAARLPGRTDNEIKNYWNTHLRKKLMQMGIDPVTHQKRTDLNFLSGIPNIFAVSGNLGSLASSSDHLNALRLQADAATLARVQLLQSLIQLIAATSSSSTTPALSLDPMNHVFGSNDQCLFNGQLGVLNNQDVANSLNLGGDHHDQKLINYKYSDAIINPCSSADHELFMESTNNANQVINCSYMDTSAHSTPSLVTTSPENNLENTTIDPTVQDPVSCFVDECISSSRNLNPFGAWEGLDLDNPNTDLCWKDILERIS
ncbi:hypothetical protein J5N97_029486 [Dioscorea zingiberensis]|uniref:Uncharacterized protein n=1 Tax=Dioscorea zingiberensis TaxID=325984 RepID=A0A9D5C108_9LILI|nr:hypothetical protein J5N97_029486 [Dioscorea zingiberensis]